MLIFYHCFFIYWLRCFSKEKLPRTIFSYPAVSFMWERQNTLFFISFQHNELILYHIPWVITELFKMFQSIAVIIFTQNYATFWLVGTSSIWLLNPFDKLQQSLVVSLFSCIRYFKIILDIFCSRTQIIHFSKEPSIGK